MLISRLGSMSTLGLFTNGGTVESTAWLTTPPFVSSTGNQYMHVFSGAYGSAKDSSDNLYLATTSIPYNGTYFNLVKLNSDGEVVWQKASPSTPGGDAYNFAEVYCMNDLVYTFTRATDNVLRIDKFDTNGVHLLSKTITISNFSFVNVVCNPRKDILYLCYRLTSDLRLRIVVLDNTLTNIDSNLFTVSTDGFAIDYACLLNDDRLALVGFESEPSVTIAETDSLGRVTTVGTMNRHLPSTYPTNIAGIEAASRPYYNPSTNTIFYSGIFNTFAGGTYSRPQMYMCEVDLSGVVLNSKFYTKSGGLDTTLRPYNLISDSSGFIYSIGYGSTQPSPANPLESGAITKFNTNLEVLFNNKITNNRTSSLVFGFPPKRGIIHYGTKVVVWSNSMYLALDDNGIIPGTGYYYPTNQTNMYMRYFGGDVLTSSQLPFEWAYDTGTCSISSFTFTLNNLTPTAYTNRTDNITTLEL